jgi:hypothetical protein
VLAVARQERDLFWRFVESGECQIGLYQGALHQLKILVTEPFSTKVLHLASHLLRPMTEKEVDYCLFKSNSAKV